MKSKKVYVCHVNHCKYNDQGSCNYEIDCVTIALYDGVAQCPNYTPAPALDERKQALGEALLQEIKSISKEIGEDVEGLEDSDLYTDSDFNCYMCPKDSQHSQDFANDERIAALIDAFNVVTDGSPLHLNFKD